VTAFQELKSDAELLDVTLACEEGQLQAHRVVLSACSAVFREILGKNKHPHPYIYLRGVKFTEMASIINFMYQGEVNVAQEKLNSFLRVAEELKVKGLTKYTHHQNGANNHNARTNNSLSLKQKIPPLPQELQLSPLKRSRPSGEMPGLSSSHIRDKEQEDITTPVLTLKPDPDQVRDPETEPGSVIIPQISWDKDDISDQEENKIAGYEEIWSKLERSGKIVRCRICGLNKHQDFLATVVNHIKKDHLS